MLDLYLLSISFFWCGCKLFFLFFFIYFYIYGCVGSSFLCEGFLHLRQVGATLHHGARASHCRGLSRCGAQAPDAQAQELWLTGLVAAWHMGSSQTRARTRVPCIGRQILNHCATWEARKLFFLISHSNCSLLLYRHTINFCILIMHRAVLKGILISCRSFFVDSLNFLCR